jgi:3-deoxy-D-manno-octulosonic-acid transferase
MNLATLYRGATGLIGPLVPLMLARRRTLGKEDPARLAERMGTPSRPRPAGRLVWAHAASNGESMSLLPLLDRLLDRDPGLSVLVTTGTLTSARLLADRLPPRAFHQFVPVDRPRYVKRFLDHWRPDLAVWVESELWPNLVLQTAALGRPMLLLNARMSARSLARWQRWPGLIRPVLEAFDLVLAQDPNQAGRLAELGARSADCIGNLKFSGAPLPVREADLAALQSVLGDRPTWLAASTHEGEEAVAAEAHIRLRDAGRADLVTIIVPRHPTRAAGVVQALRDRGLTVAQRSLGQLPVAGTDIFLADTIGELGLFYRLAPIVFVGGSITPKGGHNPLEPAILDSAILHGPDMANCAGVAADLDAAGAAVTVTDGASLAEAIALWLDEPDRRATAAARAAAVAARQAGVLDAVMTRITPFLPDAGSAHAGA